jgi:L-ascorbate metabolism protein UlaG (beta-lactamase superfamily)
MDAAKPRSPLALLRQTFLGALLAAAALLLSSTGVTRRPPRPDLSHLLSLVPHAPPGHRLALGPGNTTFVNPWPTWTGTASPSQIFTLLLSWDYIMSLLPHSETLPVDTPVFPAAPATMTATWLGHSGLFVQQANVTYLVDPILAYHCSPLPPLGPPRLNKPPFESYEQLAVAARMDRPLDFVLISHAHFDHLSTDDIALIDKLWAPHYYVPHGVDMYLVEEPLSIPAARITTLVWWQSIVHVPTATQSLGAVRVRDPVEITLTPSQHWSRRGFFDKNLALHGGFAVNAGSAARFYYVGDSGYTPNLFSVIGRELGPFDLAAIPIGAYKPRRIHRTSHMDPEHALVRFVLRAMSFA